MIAADRVWALLGIDPTEDTRAIRAAYARQLKTIDPETDPKAFVQLRGAFDAAMGQPGSATEAIEAAAPLAPDYPIAAQQEDAAERHAKAILALLYGHQGNRPWLDDAAQEALIAHWRALTADPRMEQIDHDAQVERWARSVIVETSPLSAPILMLAAERFKWIDADTRANADPYMAEIARRYRLLNLLHAASTPGDPRHSAWLTLKRAKANSSHGKVDPQAIFEILAAMRYALPQLESEFDRARVEYWEGRRHYPVEVRDVRRGGWKGCLAAAILVPLMLALATWLATAMTHAIGAGAVR